MSADLKTIERGWVGGITRFEKWRDEFERNMIASTLEDAMRMMLAQMTPQQKDMMVKMQPELKDVIKMLEGG